MEGVRACAPLSQVQAPSLAAWGLGERAKEEEGTAAVAAPPPAPGRVPLSPSPREAPVQASPGGWTEEEPPPPPGSPPGGERSRKKAGGRERGREAGRRRREERGRDGGETFEQRTEEQGLAGGAGKGRPGKGVPGHLGTGQRARWPACPARSRPPRLGVGAHSLPRGGRLASGSRELPG